MSDESPAVVIAGPDERGAEALNADAIESILADFRVWLQEAREVPAPASAPSLNLSSLVEQFTALRQEVNLQTRSSRAQLEQNAQALDLVKQAHETMQAQQERLQALSPEEQDDLLRPLLKALIDAHDALALARREVQRLLDNAVGVPLSETSPASATEISLPFWARCLGLGVSLKRKSALAQQRESLVATVERQRSALDALLVGYDMSLQRIERALQNEALETIPCAGLPFDPETMEVVEVVRAEGGDGTIVLEVVRNGYRWRDRLFRFAQVRVAKP